MIIKLKWYDEKNGTKDLFVLVEGGVGGSEAFIGVYDDEQKAKHCSGVLACGVISKEVLTSSMEEYYSPLEDNSRKRVVVEA